MFKKSTFCQWPGCQKTALYGYDGRQQTHCAKHGKPLGMKDVKHILCFTSFIPSGLPCLAQWVCCLHSQTAKALSVDHVHHVIRAACRTNDMVDVINKICLCGAHSSPAWAPLCYECYVVANPQDLLAKGVKKTERLIGAFFNEELAAGMEPGGRSHNMMSVYRNRGADWFERNEYDYFLLGGHVVGHCDGPHHFRDTSC